MAAHWGRFAEYGHTPLDDGRYPKRYESVCSGITTLDQLLRCFRFYQLGPKVFDDQGRINPEIKFEHLAAHIWFAETGTARSTRAMKSPLLGVHNGTAYYLLYNGILGDKTLAGGNMLTMKVLAGLPKHDGPMVIYGEGTNMTNDRLRSLGIKFKKTPNDIRAR